MNQPSATLLHFCRQAVQHLVQVIEPSQLNWQPFKSKPAVISLMSQHIGTPAAIAQSPWHRQAVSKAQWKRRIEIPAFSA